MKPAAIPLYDIFRLVATVLSIFWCGATFSEIPRQLNYQGFLTSADGSPISGSLPMVFRLYDSSSGASALFAEHKQCQ